MECPICSGIFRIHEGSGMSCLATNACTKGVATPCFDNFAYGYGRVFSGREGMSQWLSYNTPLPLWNFQRSLARHGVIFVLNTLLALALISSRTSIIIYNLPVFQYKMKSFGLKPFPRNENIILPTCISVEN